jgi:hypothetical protein
MKLSARKLLSASTQELKEKLGQRLDLSTSINKYG